MLAGGQEVADRRKEMAPRRRIAVLIVAALPAGTGVAVAVSADAAEADSEGTR